MLLPEKYTDYDTSVVIVASQIIRLLKEDGPMKYATVLKSTQANLGADCKFEFQNAVSFLFLLGKIEYYCEGDVLELTT